MKSQAKIFALLGRIATCGAIAVSCSNTADDCAKTATCSPISAGGKAGAGTGAAGQGTAGAGVSGSKSTAAAGAAGRASTAGTAGSGQDQSAAGSAGESTVAGAAGAAGAVPVLPCAGKCGEPTAYCRVDSDSCVACLNDTHCSIAAPACRDTDNSCVACTKDAHCSGASPVCDTATNACVMCLTDATCGTTTPRCRSDTKTCVACLESKDCPSASAARCDLATNRCAPCATHADCANVSGKAICAEGTCVQCTGKDFTACGLLEGKALVCDSAKQICTSDKKAQSAGPCQPCVSDAQCKGGQICAQQVYKGKPVGFFCFWKQGDVANGAPSDCTAETNRPFVNIQAGIKSIDNEVATVCTLRAVSTCVALNQYSAATSCAGANGPDDKLCGSAPGEDSKCVPFGASQHLCTTTCLSPVDCKGSGANSPITCDVSATPSVCTL